jgi:tetratricopeptide (TPR) repeat protein/tRNA A-37 threonylcarbamoyl transferase component Bud32
MNAASFPDEQPNLSATQSLGHRTESPPKTIGKYHVKRELASGGMGTVYEATQESPRRVVAVKVLKHGIASRSAMRRFEYEAQILARLRHPGIAQIYEAGIHDDGRGVVPYFAMEYIPNARPITTYATERKLGTRERLYLFATVCDAVYHGHQKGIIHRDLKPGNILVDSQGGVKVIDFGVARGTDSDLVVTTLQTDIGQLVGTVQYMSPEQCHADPHDIDTRSDVYALGVVLYELLCARPPYDISRASVYEATRIICEQPPAKPSTTNKTLRGELETVVLKALEKERERRYQSAADLAADIRRYLVGEAIAARRPSFGYQLRVFVRRNRALVGMTGAVFAAFGWGFVTSSYLYVQAERRREETASRLDSTARELESTKAAAAAAANASGLFFGQSGNFLDAVKEFKRATEINPQVVKYWEGLLWAQLNYVNTLPPGKDPTSWLEEAEATSRRTLRIDPHSIPTLNYRRAILHRLNRYAEAIEVCKTVTAMPVERFAEDPNYKAAWANLGVLQALNRDLEEAHRNMVRGTEMFGSQKGNYAAASWRNLAALELQMGDVPRATEHIQRAVECKSDEPASLILRARIMLTEQGKEKDALFHLNRVQQELGGNDNARVKRLQALALLQEGNFLAAINAAERAVELNDLPTTNWIIVATAQAKMDRREEARDSLKAAFDSWPADLQQPGSYRVTAEKGELWFESADELHRLRTESERLLDTSKEKP